MPDLNSENIVIIHAGMHKTGSSSIQKNLLSAQLNNELQSDIPTQYFSLGPSNHSGSLRKAYSNDPGNFLSVINGTETKEQFLKNGIKKRSQFQTFFKVNNRCIISGEGIIHLSFDDLLHLKEDIVAASKKVVVFIYVREAVSFMGSAFQQRLKVRYLPIVSNTLYPKYENRFSNLENIFGPENIIYIPFSPEKLLGGNVVLDFFNRLNIPIEKSEIVHANEGMSANAVALLWCYRQVYGQSMGKDDVNSDTAMTEALRRLPGKKFSMGEETARLILQKNVEDLNWIKSRVELPDPNFDNENYVYFNRNDELIEYSLESFAEASTILGISCPSCVSHPKTIADILHHHFFLKHQ